ncbi:RNase H domain-containing protein [Nephila pilipes]|uniref:RNase H domain-containing protein n=1 Tax=Nephila pilipes TaxID=299642 RepID=A0A8X6QRR0_NEPPI|nr:RNase H domain-containing protein [Nephila pilipes]
MERVIHSRLMDWLIKNNKLHFYQTAYRAHHSTVDQLFYLCQTTIDSLKMKSHRKSMAVFLDLSVAFDCVWRQKLVHTCYNIGIKDNALVWINDFLRDRKFSVRKLCGTSWGSRFHTLKSTYNTLIRSVLEYASPIWTPASTSAKQKLDFVKHRASKIIIGVVSSTNNVTAEHECGLPTLESRRKLATVKFTNEIRYNTDHISTNVFNQWKDSERLKRSSTLQFDNEIRKNIQMAHSSLDYLPEPIILKKPPGNTRGCLNQLQPSSKKENSKVLKQKGLDTINLLSKNNMTVSTLMAPRINPSIKEVPEFFLSIQMEVYTNIESILV